jgi:hypothetical protein
VSVSTAAPGWVLVERAALCERCARHVARAWCYFASATTSTWCFCEPCVDELLEDES